MRTGAEPLSYNDPDVISKIKTKIESGGKLVFEYYGLYLGEGSVSMAGWGPVVNDATYFVEAISSSSIFKDINSWSPPLIPDKNEQLIVRLSQPGMYYYPEQC